MMFPLQPLGAFGHATGLVLGVLLGMAFGAVLERAGFGRASNLAAQFYGGDNRVFKVMFTGIATTAVSLGLLSAVGVLDMGQVTVPETFLGPQIVGGLLLGAGFVVAGYCPGTGVVAAASGSIDGIVAYVGVIFGTLVFGGAWPMLEGFYLSGGRGSVRLDQLVGLPFSVVAFGVLAMAVVAFLGAERLERWLAVRRNTEAPDQQPGLRTGTLAGVGVVALLAVLSSTSGEAAAEGDGVAASSVDAGSLARRLVDDPRGMWLVDLRDPAACAAARIPGANCRPADDTDGSFVSDLPTTRALVLYGDADVTTPDAARRWGGRVEVLSGGYAAWQRDVLTAPVLPAEPTLAQIEDWRRQSALQAFLTGSSAPPAAVVAPKKAAAVAAKKGGGC